MFKKIHGYVLCLIIISMVTSAKVEALINGEDYVAQSVSTLRIQIQHEHYLQSVNQWRYYDSKCTAVILGTKPLTLITAAHCLKEVKLLAGQSLPEVAILHAHERGLSNAKLIKAFYAPYQQVSEDITADMAVLVFDVEILKPIKSVAILHGALRPNQSLLICGYGKGYLEENAINPRCAQRAYLENYDEFPSVLPPEYKAMDEMLYLKSQAQFDYTKEIVRTKSSVLAINRINHQGLYDNKLPMVTEGDSGGPWLMRNDDNSLTLVAISTLVERFYNKNAYWHFFNKDTPLSDYPYVAYGLKLNDKSAHTFLEYCKKNGADITFSGNGW